jgi:hypothetical protein
MCQPLRLTRGTIYKKIKNKNLLKLKKLKKEKEKEKEKGLPAIPILEYCVIADCWLLIDGEK